MPNIDKDALAALNDLIATCRDAESGFGKAAKGVHSDELRDMFTNFSRERSDFAEELIQAVRDLGETAETGGHFGGVLHRGWIGLEQRIRPKEDESFVSESLRADETTVQHYDHALGRNLPEQARAIVQRQRMRVLASHERLRAMQLMLKY